MLDPNPAVNGKGILELKDAGVQVEQGVLIEDAERLNEAYTKFVTTGRPFVILKVAASLDGKIALPSGESKWITGEEARAYAHRLRSLVDAVLVGLGTVRRDDPQLSVRLIEYHGRQPLRVVVDSSLRIPLESRILDVTEGQKTLIATTRFAPPDRIEDMKKMGIDILLVDQVNNRVSLGALMKALGEMGIMSALIEGGSEVNASALEERVVDKVIILYSPRIIGGRDSIPMVGGSEPESLEDSVFVRNLRFERIGEDLLLEGYVEYNARV